MLWQKKEWSYKSESLRELLPYRWRADYFITSFLLSRWWKDGGLNSTDYLRQLSSSQFISQAEREVHLSQPLHACKACVLSPSGKLSLFSFQRRRRAASLLEHAPHSRRQLLPVLKGRVLSRAAPLSR